MFFVCLIQYLKVQVSRICKKVQTTEQLLPTLPTSMRGEVLLRSQHDYTRARICEERELAGSVSKRCCSLLRSVSMPRGFRIFWGVALKVSKRICCKMYSRTPQRRSCSKSQCRNTSKEPFFKNLRFLF